MSAWGSDSVVRSIRRSIMGILPASTGGWAHRVEKREIAEDERPVTVTLLGNASVTSARETLDQGEIVTQWSVTLYAYPALGADPRAARREGDVIRDSLHNLIRFGLALHPTLRNANGRPMSGPYRMPLWNWTGVAMDAPAAALPALPHDVIWVDRASVVAQNIADPDDPRRRSVVVEFRITVESPGRVRGDAGPVVASLPGYPDFE